MRTLKYTRRNKEKIDSLPRIFLIGLWAHYGVREYAYAGKTNETGIPYVWDLYDGNGTCLEYHMVLLTDTTTGWVQGWTVSKSEANKIADALNIAEKKSAKKRSDTVIHDEIAEQKTIFDQIIE